MKPYIFEGNIVRLRAIEENDWKSFREMDHDSETQRGAGEIPFPGSVKHSQEWAKTESMKEPESDVFRFAIEHIADGLLAGTINTHSINKKNGTFSYGLGIHPSYRRQGCASEAILLVLNYYFKELRYQKCNAGVYRFNPASYELHKKLGFVHEGTLRQMEFSNGEFHDHIVFGMTKDEFEELHGERFKIDLPPIRLD